MPNWKKLIVSGSDANLNSLDITANNTIGGLLKVADGSNSAPSITFTDDTDTGIYRSADNSFNITVGGVNKFVVNSSGITSGGNVYSGNSSQFRNYGGVWKATTGLTGNGFEFSNSVDGTALTLSSTGNAVFAGTIATGGDLTIGGTGGIFIPEYIYHVGDTNTYLGFETNDTFRVVTGGSERLNINSTRTRISNGNLEINGGHLLLEDSKIIKLGDGGTFQIWHQAGTNGNSFIDEQSTGELYIRSNSNINLAHYANNTLTANFNPLGPVELYYSGSKKFETRTGGATVSGSLIVDANTSNLVGSFVSTDSIAEIRIQDSTKYTRLLTVGTQFKLMPNNGSETLILDGNDDSATFAGNITVSNASPALNLTDTDNSSNIALSSVGGALIVNSTSDQVYQIGGTEEFRIDASSATFAGDVIVGPKSNATVTVSESGGATTKLMGASVGRVGTYSNHNFEIVQNSSAAITIDTSKNSTFAGDITTAGNIILSGASNEIIKSNGSIRLNIDSDNNQTDRIFIVSTGANSELFRVSETGYVTAQSTIKSQNGILALGNDVTIFRDGANILRTDDTFHANNSIHVGGDGKIYDRANTSNYIELADTINISTDTSVTGDLTVTGTITAQEFKSEFVSASIVYQSGSTKFGDTSDDVHSFSGSLQVTGSGAHYFTDGKLVVGSTTSNYKFGVTGGHMGVSNGGNIYVGGFGADAVIGYLGNSSGVFTLRSDGNRDISIGSGTVNNSIFIEGSNGNVGIGTTSPNSKLDIRRAGNGVALELIQTSGNVNDYIDLKMIAGNTTAGTLGTILRHKRDGSGGGDFSILTNPTLTGTPTEKLTITSAGALKLNSYGSGTHTGTLAKSLGVDSSGNIIEFSGGSGGSVSSITNGADNRIATFTGADALNGEANLTFDGNIFAVNTDELYVSASRVGIGTSDPAVTLHVDGFARLNGGLQLNQNGAAQIYQIQNNSLRFGTNNTERMRILADGKVGIGTTSPGQKLEVAGRVRATTDPTFEVYNSSANRGGIQWSTGVSGTNIFAGGGSSAGAVMTFQTNTAERMRIDSSGNVGIGITTPSSRLYVKGSTSNSTADESLAKFVETSGTDNGITKKVIDSSISRNSWSNSDQIAGYFESKYISRIGNSNGYGISALASYDQNYSDAGSESFAGTLFGIHSKVSVTQTTGNSFAQNAYGLFVDDLTIGTNAKLTNYYGIRIAGVTGSGTVTNQYALVTDSDAGNVGIGTTTPDNSLELFKEQDGDYLGLKISKLHSNGYEYITEYGNNQLKFSGNQNYNFYNDSNKVADFHNAHTKFYGNGGVLKMNISGSGEVIIGALSSGATGQLVVNHEGGVPPVAKFMSRTNKATVQISDNDTTGYISSENGLFSLGRNAGVNATNININASHNVGIGTSNPGQKLHIYKAGNNAPLLVETDDHSGIKIKGGNSHDRYISFQQVNGSVGSKIGWDHSSQTLKLNAVDSFASTHLVVDVNGNVGIGSAAPARKLDVNGEIQNNGIFRRAGNVIIKSTGSETMFGPGGSGIISFHSSATMTTSDETVRIDANGNLLLNNTSAGARLDIREDSNYAIRAEDASGHYFRVNTGGDTEIRGDLTVQGTVIAQEFHTEFVSASIIYESGSTKFGDTSDDVHSFTGSLNILSGSATIKGPGAGLTIHNSTNGAGSLIRFTDQGTGQQTGDITFYHSDGQSQGGGASWHFVSEPDTVLVVGSSSVNGRFIAKSAGSTGEVDYGFYDDQNTGMVRTSADNVSLVAGGVRGVGVGATAVSLKYAGSTKLATSNTGVTVTGDIDADDITIDDWGSVSASLSTIQQAGGVNGSGAANRIATWSDADTLTSSGNLSYSSGTLNLNQANYTSIDISSAATEHSSMKFSSGSVEVGRIGWHNQGYFAASAMSVNPSPAMFINSANGFDFAVNNTGSLSIKSGSADVIIDEKVNVGIGAASPVYKLDVRGDIGTDRYIRHTGDSNTYFGFSGDDTIQFNTAGSERLRIDSTGNVGIGGSPGAKLDVNAGVTNTVAIFESTDDKAFIIVKDDDTSSHLITKDSKFHIGSSSTDYAKFNVNVSTGRVGIGTAAPLGELHIYNTATTSDGDGTATETANGQDSILLYGHGGTNGQTYGGITWMGGSRRRAMISALAENTDTDYVGLAFYTQGVDGSGDFNESMRIAHNGNVGIGHTTLHQKFTVNGNIDIRGGNGSYLTFNNGDANITIHNNGTGRDLSFKTYNPDNGNNAERMRLDKNGDLGIGTASPQEKLHVYNAGTARIEVEGTTGPAAFKATNSQGSFGWYVPSNANNFRLWNFGTSADLLTVDASGNATFAGEVNTGGNIVMTKSSGNNQLYINSSGGGAPVIYLQDPNRKWGQFVSNGHLYFKDETANVTSLKIDGVTSNATFAGNVSINGSLTLGDSTADSATIGLKHLLGYCENTDVDTGTETIKELALATYQAVFFDYVVKNGTNLRAGTVTAVHDGTNVEFTDTSTKDLGSTSAVTLSVDISGTNMRLRATTTSDNWIVKANIRGIKV